MRGKQLLRLAVRIARRITPAHAGKTASALERVEDKSDHPRACGENPAYNLSGDGELGSPPRMRGKRRQTIDNNGGARITPAHAGKT